jgi:hypothetical protein
MPSCWLWFLDATHLIPLGAIPCMEDPRINVGVVSRVQEPFCLSESICLASYLTQ